MVGSHVKFDVSLDDLLADLTTTAYQVALKNGMEAPFITVELELMEALRESIKKNMVVCNGCGGSTFCMKLERCEPWSVEADTILELHKQRKYSTC